MEVSTRTRHPKRGFTLVELLTVIVIIGILAGLISAAVVAAVTRAKQARVTLEIKAMEQALKTYKEKYGDYPPDTVADRARVTAHLRRAFPRYPAGGGDPWNQFVTDLGSCGLSPTSMDSAAALVFWLGGVPRGGGGWIPDGFSKDPERPFQRGGPHFEPLFEFVPERLKIVNTGVHYYPEISGAIAAACPYYYFRARDDNYNLALPQSTEQVLPYGRQVGVATVEWYNPRTFQIISAGMDNKYGDTGGSAPVIGVTNLPSEHYDNLTNFTDGKLEDLLQ